MRRFQHFKTLICKGLLLSNMQIDTKEENIRQKRSFLNDSFWLVFALYFHLG